MSPNYHNEWDPYCAQWLRNLIAAGNIPAGDVDERDIREVRADDLKRYGQVHFFAGIGGWSLALRLAGWPDDEPVWTGSCPCQPLSSAGKRQGHADERHLWPAFQSLISERRPATVLGEQVASKDGREWLAGIRADLEHLGYAVGAADLPAAGVGAPHIRQRLWWVADSEGPAARSGDSLPTRQSDLGDGRPDGGMGDAAVSRERAYDGQPGPCAEPQEPLGRSNLSERLANDLGARLEGGQVEPAREERAPAQRNSGTGFWPDFGLISCGDGKARRVEPGIQPLAHGVPARVGKLRAAGNAIVPQVAAGFIGAVMEARP